MIADIAACPGMPGRGYGGILVTLDKCWADNPSRAVTGSCGERSDEELGLCPSCRVELIGEPS